jgi:hypothetical protein
MVFDSQYGTTGGDATTGCNDGRPRKSLMGTTMDVRGNFSCLDRAATQPQQLGQRPFVHGELGFQS